MTDESDADLFRCPNCTGVEFERGVVDDDQRGRVRWIAGAGERGLRGRARSRGRRSSPVVAHRCVRCSRLELYAGG